jgi:hypothetical protein
LKLDQPPGGTPKIYIHMIPEEMDEAVDAVGKVMMGGG